MQRTNRCCPYVVAVVTDSLWLMVALTAIVAFWLGTEILGAGRRFVRSNHSQGHCVLNWETVSIPLSVGGPVPARLAGRGGS